MASFQKFQKFVEALAEGKHDFSVDQLKIALSNVAPDQAADGVLADITEIDYTGLSSRNVTTSSSSQTGGLYKLILAALTLVASGDIDQFQYIILYNDDAPSDELIGFWDNGDPVDMVALDEFDINFSATSGVLQLQ